MSQLNKRKRNRVILTFIILGLVLGFFGLLMRSPETGNAFTELSKCTNVTEVENVWGKYNSQQFNNQEFENKTREKLTAFNLSSSEINACLDWLPATPTHVNLIVVPDLSNRISNSTDYPGQYDRDMEIMRTIWKTFTGIVGNRESKHQMAVVTTDDKSANGILAQNFSNLYLDMNGVVNNPDHVFFTPYRTTKFNRNCREIYEYAINNPITTDFYSFFKSDLTSYLKPPTLFDRYKNKVIIMSNGIITNDSGGGTTEIEKFSKKFIAASSKDSLITCITNNGLNLKPVQIDWTNTEVLICEINGGGSELGFHTEVLSAYWEDWFKKMNCPLNLIKSGRPEPMVCSQIRTFIEN